MFTTKTLKKMPYAQAKVRIYDNGTIEMISYATVVCIIKNNIVYCTGTYSQTTRKHISAFMSEYTPFNYYTVKAIAGTDMGVSCITGEIVCL